MEKTQHLTPLLNKVEALAQMIAVENFQGAAQMLQNDVRKHAEKWLVETPAGEGEATKEEIEAIITTLAALLGNLSAGRGAAANVTHNTAGEKPLLYSRGFAWADMLYWQVRNRQLLWVRNN